MTYEKRAEYACKVCGNVPDDDGRLWHGKGCYTQSEDGGGTSYVEMTADTPTPAPPTVPEAFDHLCWECTGSGDTGEILWRCITDRYTLTPKEETDA